MRMRLQVNQNTHKLFMNQTIAVCHLQNPQAPGAPINPSCTERLRSQLPPVACIRMHHIQLLSNLQIVICLTAHPLLSGAVFDPDGGSAAS